jgi:hypothetical protein
MLLIVRIGSDFIHVEIKGVVSLHLSTSEALRGLVLEHRTDKLEDIDTSSFDQMEKDGVVGHAFFPFPWPGPGVLGASLAATSS